MNILVFSWRDPMHPLAGGAEQVMHEHMKGWISKGHKVTLFSSNVRSLPKNEIIDNVKIIRSGYQYLGVQINALFYYIKNKNKIDFVVDQFHGVPFFTPLYVNKPKLAVIQEPAKAVWFKNLLPFPINYIIGFLGFVFEPLFFFFYKKTNFMTGSNSAREDVAKYGIPLKNITVVPHGVILPYLDFKHKFSSVPVITSLGTLSKDKGIEDVLKCFAILNKSNDYKYWLIGKPETKEYLATLKQKIADYGLEGKVKFWGRPDDNKKYKLLSESFVLVNASVHEGWGLVNIEANVVGTPVVAYPSRGLVDSVKHHVSGILTKNCTPEDLAMAINNLVENKDEYNKLVKGSIKWASGFSWEKSKKLSLDLIHV